MDFVILKDIHIILHQQKYPKVPKPKTSFKYSKQIVKEIPYDCSICGNFFHFYPISIVMAVLQSNTSNQKRRIKVKVEKY